MSDENKAIARRWFEEIFNAQNLDVADEITAQDSINHDPTLGDLPSGPEGDKQVVNLYHGAFPDANITYRGPDSRGRQGGHPMDGTWYSPRRAYGRCAQRQPDGGLWNNDQPHL